MNTTYSTTTYSTMHVNPVASDGQYTIGYDDNGVPGQWPGNMSETTNEMDWMDQDQDSATFCDGNEYWFVNSYDMWQNEAGTYKTHYRDVLKEYGAI